MLFRPIRSDAVLFRPIRRKELKFEQLLKHILVIFLLYYHLNRQFFKYKCFKKNRELLVQYLNNVKILHSSVRFKYLRGKGKCCLSCLPLSIQLLCKGHTGRVWFGCTLCTPGSGSHIPLWCHAEHSSKRAME